MNKRSQMRPLVDLKTRDENGNPIVEGYFAVFGARYEEFPGEFEELMPGCFSRSIEENDIRALVNHDSTQVLGRNKSGTLVLREDERGLFGTIRINPKDSDAMNLHARIEREDVTQASFGFFVRGREVENLPDGKVLNRIVDADLLEISPCTFPAYPKTHLSAREKNLKAEKQRAEENTRWKEEMLGKLRRNQMKEEQPNA